MRVSQRIADGKSAVLKALYCAMERAGLIKRWGEITWHT
ncbi:hypothetical protein GMES_0531 [Paraglaciecola mesophila KMM 241]|uniref:Uncharacterized protein n=1 Tax=Paraglaciecola mesophila KMM 241 TaxID=1128912 RepID=K6YXF7_9ALTE|nr:hypothetical protein GMES_0531 [Paraglaciecola mesophila KMM 241]